MKILTAMMSITILLSMGSPSFAIYEGSDLEALCEEHFADKKPEVARCPVTTIMGKASDCLLCHIIGNFRVKETVPDKWRDYPNRNMRVVEDGKQMVAYYYLTEIYSGQIDEFFNYITRYNIKQAVLEIHSPGGSLFDAWRIVGLMNVAKTRGIVVETRCNGFAASAGFLIFISGTMGHRAISPTAELMWHELYSLKFLAIDTPSSSEDEARTLRHLQDTANAYIASRSSLTKDELDKRVRNKEFWMNGAQALKDGFADIELKSVITEKTP